MKSDAHPEWLYHGSRFQQKELMPGLKRTGKLVKWDETESNEYLYTTSVLEMAIELGFSSSIEKVFNVSRFHVVEQELHIETEDTITLKDLEKIPVFLYTIAFREEDGWVKNRNKNNGITTEFKTDQTIHVIASCEAIDVRAWLSQYEIQIKRKVHGGAGCGKEVSMESVRPSWLGWAKK